MLLPHRKFDLNNTEITDFLLTLMIACPNTVWLYFPRRTRKIVMGFTSSFKAQLYLVTYHYFGPTSSHITSMTGTPLLQYLIFAFS